MRIETVRLFGLTISRTKLLPPLQPISGRGGWFNIIGESFTGAWQRNVEVKLDNVLTYYAVYACVTLIASDIGKLRLRLVQQDDDGIWNEIETAAYSPVLRKPNRYQTRIKFIEQWIVSKLIHGNTYILKERDNRGVVVALYVLDPCRTKPLVAPDGSVYYQLGKDDLSGVPQDFPAVPAPEIIHDTMVALYHPLCGVSPITACGLAAVQGLNIQKNSAKFFENGSQPGGVLTAPAGISEDTAARIKKHWEDNYTGVNVGKVAVLGDGLKYEAMSANAVDSQLIEQLKMTGEQVCSTFHVPAYMIGIGPMPPYNNIQALNQQYYSQALQSPLECIELLLDEGLGLTNLAGKTYGTEFNLDDLLKMDTATQYKTYGEGIGSGLLAPDEARLKINQGPVPGGASPYLQQQNYSLEALSKRDAQADPFASKNPAAQPAPPTQRAVDDSDTPDLAALTQMVAWEATKQFALAA